MQAGTGFETPVPETKTALFEAAERLFAAFGIASVSMRAIGKSVDAISPNVVSYYFGSKEALVEAIIRHRLPAIDERRRKLMQAADVGGGSQEMLLDALFRPLLEQIDASGGSVAMRPSYRNCSDRTG